MGGGRGGPRPGTGGPSSPGGSSGSGQPPSPPPGGPGSPGGTGSPGGPGGSCINTDSGATNSKGAGCEWYSDRPFICDDYDDDDFNATQMCCSCRQDRRAPRPEWDSDCSDTNNHALDRLGRHCSDYEKNHLLCGYFDTAHFVAGTMCCTCGGGVHGPSCPHSATSAAPDSEGLCRCGPDHECVDTSSTPPGSGCPAGQGGRRSSSRFEVGCKSCRCMNEAAMPSLSSDKVCEARFVDSSLPDTSESWMVFGVLTRIQSRLERLAVGLADVRLQWLGSGDRDELLVRSNFITEPVHRRWAQFLFGVVVQSGYVVKSCGIYLPHTGEGISMENGGCENPTRQILLSTANDNGRLHAYRVHGVDTCHEGAVRHCLKQTVWVEGWSANDTSVAYLDGSGNWAQGVQDHDTRHEGWFEHAMDPSNGPHSIKWLGRWVSHVSREVEFGLGQRLENPDSLRTEGVARCTMSVRALSNYLKTLAGAGARIFAIDSGGGLLGASVGRVEMHAGPGGVVNTPILANESDDGVVRQVGAWLAEDRTRERLERLKRRDALGRTSSTLAADVRWEEMEASLKTYVAYGGEGLELFLVYVEPPRCLPGREMRVGRSTDLAKCTECRPGNHSADPRGQVVGTMCSHCSEGTYTQESGETMCYTCERGKFLNVKGRTVCQDCPANTTSDPGADSIQGCKCKRGYYSPTGSHGIDCLPCPKGSECNGEDGPPLAKPHYYTLFFQVHGRRLYMLHDIHGQDAYGVNIKCANTMHSNPCMGGREGNESTPRGALVMDNVCLAGYEGVACSHCSKGWYRFGRDCLPCESGGEPALRFYWVCFIVVFYLLRRVVNSKYKTLYIFLSALQVFGLQGGFPLAWPSSIKLTMRIIQIANLQVDLLMPSCEREADYPWKYLMYLSMPWFFLIVDLIVISVARLFRACCQRREEKKQAGVQSGSVPAEPPPLPEGSPPAAPHSPRKCNLEVSQLPGDQGADDECEGKEATGSQHVANCASNGAETERCASTGEEDATPRRSISRSMVSHVSLKTVRLADAVELVGNELTGVTRRRVELVRDFAAQTLLNMRLMYLPLCGRTLDMIQCTYFENGMRPRLSQDMDLHCWEGLHLSFMPAVGVFGTIYLVGTPLAYILMLLQGYRSNALYSKAHLRRYGLLYARFEPSFYFWELVIMLRRVLAVVIKTLLNLRTAEFQADGYIGNFQAALMCSVMVLALAVHFYARPFGNPFLNFGDAWYLFATFLSCIIGICFSAARTETEFERLEVMWFLNLFAVVAVTVCLVWMDIEVVHPAVSARRRKMTHALGLHALVPRVKARLSSALTSGRKLEVSEIVDEIDFATLQGKPALGDIFKSVVARATSEKLEHLGIHAQHINAILSEGGRPNSVLVRVVIEPPNGISAELVSKALADHSLGDLAHSLMIEMVEVTPKTRQLPTGSSAADPPIVNI